MANFVLSNTPPLQWAGGPANHCSVCRFPSETHKWYVTVEGTHIEEPQPLMNGQWTERPFVLCEQHATEFKSTLDDILPDPRLPKAQAQVLSAEAARARAEKRAEAAEKALHSMQDWLAEAEAK